MSLIKRDESFEGQIAAPAAWNTYLFIGLKFILIFSLCTLLLEDYVFFAHQGQAWILADYLLFPTYLLIIILALTQMIKKLPMAAIMLAAPIIPLFMLLIILLSLPLLHLIHKPQENLNLNKLKAESAVIIVT